MTEGTLKLRLTLTWALSTTALLFFTWAALVLLIAGPARDVHQASQMSALKSVTQQHADTLVQDQGESLQKALVAGDLGEWISLEAKLDGRTVARLPEPSMGLPAEIEVWLGLNTYGPSSNIKMSLAGGQAIEATGVLQPLLSPGLALACLVAVFASILTASLATAFYVHNEGRRAFQGLSSIRDQAEALNRGELVIVEGAPIKELDSIFGDFNQSAISIYHQVLELKKDVTVIKSEIDHDELTGTVSRPVFVDLLSNAIEQEHAGHVMFVRIVGLAEMNASVGRNRADEFIRSVATAIRVRLFNITKSEPVFARMNGSEFGLFLTGLSNEEIRGWGAQLAMSLRELHESKISESPEVAYIGVTELIANDSASKAMSRADSAVTSAQFNKADFVYLRPDMQYAHISIAEWRVIIENSLNSGRIELAFFPVVDPVLNLIHNECVLRLRAPDEAILPAREFLPAAIRCHRILDLDLRAIELALDQIKKTSETVAVNLAPQSISRPYFVTRLTDLLQSNIHVADRLCLEVSELGLYNHIDELVVLTTAVGKFGVRVGIDHFATSFQSLPSLHSAKVDYVKMDASYCDGVAGDIGKQRFLQVVISIASSLGIATIAQRVSTKEDFEALVGMGVAALTGPYVSRCSDVGG
jgi:EAL domain-containing protein (putative c-di-GMP-specific phosphodiesterase class I)/GGDEF domain-containing protein